MPKCQLNVRVRKECKLALDLLALHMHRNRDEIVAAALEYACGSEDDLVLALQRRIHRAFVELKAAGKMPQGFGDVFSDKPANTEPIPQLSNTPSGDPKPRNKTNIPGLHRSP